VCQRRLNCPALTLRAKQVVNKRHRQLAWRCQVGSFMRCRQHAMHLPVQQLARRSLRWIDAHGPVRVSSSAPWCAWNRAKRNGIETYKEASFRPVARSAHGRERPASKGGTYLQTHCYHGIPLRGAVFPNEPGDTYHEAFPTRLSNGRLSAEHWRYAAKTPTMIHF